MQLNYSQNMDPGAEGGAVDMGFVKENITGVGADKLFIGKLVVLDPALPDGVKHPTGAGDIDPKTLRGVIRSAADRIMNRDDADAPYYLAKDPVNVLRKGRIWVKVDGAVTKGTTEVRVAAGGLFVATGGLGVVPKARYVSSTTGPGLAQIELDF